MAKTAKPSGLTIARNNMTFTFSWKITDKDYGAGQQLQWRTNLTAKGKWTNVSIGADAKSKSVSLTAATYYPTAKKYLQSVTFRVRGRRKKYTTGSGKDKKTYTPDWSDWTEKTFTTAIPAMPTLTATLTESNVCRFSWNLANDVKSNKPFVNVEWQTILVKASNVADGSTLRWKDNVLGWGTGTGGASSAITRTEETELLAADSYTRWVRVRARGARGASAWRYAKHVYAKPYSGAIDSASVSTSGGRTTARVTWTVNANNSHPIDLTTLQYALEIPAAGQTCPNDADWIDAATSRDTSKQDAAAFTFTGGLGTDQCLFFRIQNQHDANVSYSAYYLAKRGRLATPVITNIETNAGTYRATITATNESDVPDARLAVVYRAEGVKDFVVGIIPNGSTSVTVQCPAWESAGTIAFGVYAFQGAAEEKERSDGASCYAITANMTSPTVWQGGTVPVAPENVSVVISSEESGEVIITWDWTWNNADKAELSWSRNPNAWESTDEPTSYLVSNLNTALWRISGLVTGETWYFRVRLAKSSGQELTYGPYSETVSVDLSSAPSIPVLTLSAAVITEGGSVTASWAYSTTDGTSQAYAEICEAEVDGDGITYGDIIAHTTGEQHVTIGADTWQVGTTHYLCVRVTSASGHISDGWSDPVPITVAEPLSCVIVQDSLIEQTVEDDDGVGRTVNCLTVMPLTATVTGAGEGGTTTLIIERAAEYHMERPDGSTADGYEGETVALFRQTGETQISISEDELIGLLDDGAPYRLIAIVEDGLGQSAQTSIEFEVHWSHQAGVPDATVTIEDMAAVITPIAPEEYAAGDVCDIYRLSADAPELVVQNGAFGTVYVDPYPTIGEYGGHRIVHRTLNGDYITSDNHPAWMDTGVDEGDLVEEYSIIIEFGGQRLILPNDITLSNRWSKDFQLTSYLGGSQQGDWNPAVERTATYTTDLIADEDEDTIRGMRDLAAFSGICHIRTPEGSSFAADIQVSETKDMGDWEMVSYTLSVTRVDPENLDGMTYAQWIETAEEEEG